MFIFQMSPTFNPLAIILSHNKLTGPNYVEWNWNLHIVLTAEGTSLFFHSHALIFQELVLHLRI